MKVCVLIVSSGIPSIVVAVHRALSVAYFTCNYKIPLIISLVALLLETSRSHRSYSPYLIQLETDIVRALVVVYKRE